MKNTTAIATSAGLVLAVAGACGAMYVSAAPADDVPPATEVIVEYVDEQGNVVPIETTIVASGATADTPTDSSTAERLSDGNQDDEYEHDEYEHDDEEGDDDD